MNKLEAIESSEIRTEAIDFSFGEILNLHADREIIIRPEYQRLFRWSNEQRSRLIESLLLRLPIPPIFLVEDEHGILELIDGLQRTSSVLQFIDHNSIGEPPLRLTGCDIVEELNGLNYEDLPTTARLRLKRTAIRAIVIRRSGDEYVKYEMFKRLNTGGELLSAQEIRNCSSRMISGGAEFYEMLQSLAQNKAFRTSTNRIPQTDLEKRANEELALRFFAVLNYRERFSGNVKEWLDDFMEACLFRKQSIEDWLGVFYSTFEVIAEKLGDRAFSRRKNDEPVGRLAPAYFEAVVGAFAPRLNLVGGARPEKLDSALTYAFGDDRFVEATGPGANAKWKMDQRIRVVGEYLDRAVH